MRHVTVVTIFVAFMCVAIFITAFTMSLKMRPLKRQVIFPPPPPTAAPTLAPTASPTDAPTASPTAPPPTDAPTTAAPTFAPLTLVCPPDINITLGSSLGLDACGFPTVSGGDVPACGAPVAFFSDEAVGVVARSGPAFVSPLAGGPVSAQAASAAAFAEGASGGRGGTSDEGGLGRRGSGPGKTHKRSPSFSAANIVPETFQTAGGVNVSYTSMALTVDGTYYLTAMETGDALTLYNDSNGVTFSLNGTQGSVHWDADVFRFVIVENSANANFVYVHLNTSATLDAPGSWETFVLYNVSGNNPMLAIWPQAYVVAVAAPSKNICVVNREEILNPLLIPENATGPTHFCATSISGGLSGFPSSARRSSWTPLGVRSVSTVNSEVESAGTESVGAVWMRHHDDELHNGAATPLFDWIDVEHWTNINWTTRDYISLRYAVSVTDFDSSYADCPDANRCIPTPAAGVYLDARRENIAPNLHYSANGQRVTATYVSHANGRDVANVRWVEFKWQSPTNLLAARFVLSQQGTIDDVTAGATGASHRWLPTSFMDSYSTSVVGYNVANNDTVWPGMRASSRLLNDPPNGMRNEVTVLDGESDTSLSDTSVWGPWCTLDSAVPRNFTYTCTASRGDEVQRVSRHLRITGNIIHRTFTGANNCNQTTCVQVIVEQ